jgi:hypothetical protein
MSCVQAFFAVVQTLVDGLVSSLNYTSTLPSNAQDQLDAIVAVDTCQAASIASKASLTGTNTITGNNIIRNILQLGEVCQSLSVSSGILTLNYGSGACAKVVPESTNFNLQLSSVNGGASSTVVNTISIDCSTYTCWATTCTINAVVRDIIFGSESTIDLTGCTVAAQTLSIIYNGNATVPFAIMSSVVPFMA